MSEYKFKNSRRDWNIHPSDYSYIVHEVVTLSSAKVATLYHLNDIQPRVTWISSLDYQLLTFGHSRGVSTNLLPKPIIHLFPDDSNKYDLEEAIISYLIGQL